MSVSIACQEQAVSHTGQNPLRPVPTEVLAPDLFNMQPFREEAGGVLGPLAEPKGEEIIVCNHRTYLCPPLQILH